jgi:hypothetical protein
MEWKMECKTTRFPRQICFLLAWLSSILFLFLISFLLSNSFNSLLFKIAFSLLTFFLKICEMSCHNCHFCMPANRFYLEVNKKAGLPSGIFQLFIKDKWEWYTRNLPSPVLNIVWNGTLHWKVFPKWYIFTCKVISICSKVYLLLLLQIVQCFCSLWNTWGGKHVELLCTISSQFHPQVRKNLHSKIP